jgi:hypothetical protein
MMHCCYYCVEGFIYRWDDLRWHDIHSKFHDDPFPDSSSIKGITSTVGARGSIVVKVLCYKPEGRGFETR